MITSLTIHSAGKGEQRHSDVVGNLAVLLGQPERPETSSMRPMVGGTRSGPNH